MTEVSIDRILASDQRARLGEFADVLIPGGHGLPSASEAKVHEKWIDRALAARPDLFEIVVTTISLSAAIVAEATLSFLGVGLPPAQYLSWGNDISAAQTDLRTHPENLLYPSLALSITVLAFIMLGEVVRDALDPKARAQR